MTGKICSNDDLETIKIHSNTGKKIVQKIPKVDGLRCGMGFICKNIYKLIFTSNTFFLFFV